MKSFLAFLLVVTTTTFCFSQSMTVHTTTGPTSFNLADIDSITFTVGTIPTDSLIAYYPFTGNANDQSGRGHNGTVSGAALTIDRFGNSNSAYSFDGVNDRITVSDAPAFDFSVNKRFTISCWAKYTGNIAEGPSVIAKWGPGADSDDEWIIWMLGDTTQNFSINPTTSPGPDLQFNIDGIFNSWVHLVLVWNGSGAQGYGACYVNGTLMGENTNTITTIPNLTQIIQIGGMSTASGNDFLGSIDDIRIYKRDLSASEVQALYHEGGW